jgi:DNA polymerase III sliding clamp (beta) subunit (PCNA family)
MNEQITIPSATLSNILSMASPLCKRAIQPILQCALIEEAGITFSDLSTTIFMPVPKVGLVTGLHSAKEPWTPRCFPVDDLQRMVSVGTAAEVQLQDSGKIIMGRSRFTVPTFEGEAYPASVDMDSVEATLNVDAALLMAALSAVRLASGVKDARTFLNGVHCYLDAGSNRLMLEATDGHRLNRVVIPVESATSLTDVDLIIGREDVAVLVRALKDAGGPVVLKVGNQGTRAVFSIPEVMEIRVALVGARFPDTNRVIPNLESRPFRIVADREAFKLALRQAIVTSDKGFVKLIVVDGQPLRIESAYDGRDAVAELEAQVSGFQGDYEIAFNGHLLVEMAEAHDFLSGPEQTTITLNLSGPGDALLTSAGHGDVIIAMPLRF